MRAAVASGYSDTTVMANHAAYGFRACLPKPFGLDELGSVLQRMVSADEDAPAG